MGLTVSVHTPPTPGLKWFLRQSGPWGWSLGIQVHLNRSCYPVSRAARWPWAIQGAACLLPAHCFLSLSLPGVPEKKRTNNWAMFRPMFSWGLREQREMCWVGSRTKETGTAAHFQWQVAPASGLTAGCTKALGGSKGAGYPHTSGRLAPAQTAITLGEDNGHGVEHPLAGVTGGE